MSSLSKDLQNYLEVVSKVAASVADATGSLDDVRGPVASAGLLDLAADTADEPDALHWLAHTVRVAAESSPSLAYVLAARFAAVRAVGTEIEAPEATFGMSVDGSRPVIASALTPETVVILEVNPGDQGRVRALPWTDIVDSLIEEPRTGLKQTRLVTIGSNEPDAGSELAAPNAFSDWDLLTGAMLAGIARRATRATQTYVQERRQFGVPIGSFAGLRAIVGEMELRVDATEALLDRALESGASIESVSAVAGQATIDTCLDAIQTFGGYGYMDEYPLSGLLRDAVSIQARAGGRRLHVSRVAFRVLGPRDEGQR